MSKKLESDLAESVRQAKQQTESTATGNEPAASTSKPGAGGKSDANVAALNDQAPGLSMDDPWANPERVWPD
ncbi:MAG TPA: hypothetical protein VKA14_00765 [Gammaproteobacteria bacterium]|nr:hypothetical protein [Gammaproteobacteria bacterium]